MNTYRYTIAEIPPSNNRYIGRSAQWEYQQEKTRWAWLVAAACRDKPATPLNRATVKLTYYFRTRRRRDPDNYSGKMILDGLTAAGVLSDDSFDNIDLVLRGKYDAARPRTEIEVAGE